MKLQDVEASFLRHLYENLTVTNNIKVFENINQIDFSALEKWIAIDSLTNSLGNEPKQLFFVHCAVQKGLKNEKSILAALVDLAVGFLEQGTRITAYDYTTGLSIGEMEVCEASLSPVLQHAGGGSFRSITIGLVYGEFQ